jgi:hypothetical protein
LISGAKLKQHNNINIMKLSQENDVQYYDIRMTKIRTARDEGQGTRDKGTTNTNEE